MAQLELLVYAFATSFQSEFMVLTALFNAGSTVANSQVQGGTSQIKPVVAPTCRRSCARSCDRSISVSAQRGFTLVELIIGIAVAAILMAIAVPTFRETAQNAEIRSTGVDLATAFNTAKALAVSERRPYTLVTTATGWTLDSVPADPDIQEQFLFGNNVAMFDLANAALPVGTAWVFGRNGLPVGGPIAVRLCDTIRAGEESRDILVSAAGRVTTQIQVCP
jgi:type IV fimbrial biogenesis protein FimT